MTFIIIAAGAGCAAIGGIFYLKYFMSDSQENRDLLPNAVLIQFLGKVIVETGAVLMMTGVLEGGVDGAAAGVGWGGWAISIAINALITFYIWKVMIKYAASK